MFLTFLGVDLSVLTYDAAEKQRKSAETMANSIKRLIKFIISYPKVLVAAVNGRAKGLGVTILPYFDIVYAKDTATFSTETYSKLGHMPEGFASQTFSPDNRMLINEMMLLGKTITASHAQNVGLVSSVIWPDKFLEEIVPRMELFENMLPQGLKAVKSSMNTEIKRKINSNLVDDETKELIGHWTAPNFAKNVREYIKVNYLDFQ